MAQYLLSVHGSDTDPIPDNVQEMYAAVDKFNKKLQASGSWVFAGGLNPASTATVVDGDRRRRPGDHRRALPGVEGTHRRLLDRRRARPRRRARTGPTGSAACRGAVEVRPFQPEPDA